MIARLLNSPWTWALLLLFYCVGLSSYSVPLTGDQKVYLSIALEMRERSSLLIPYLYSHANFLKPPFEYWMTLLGWQVFGFNLFGALIPSVLALLGSAYWVRRIAGTKDYLPAVFFAGTLGTLTYGTTAQMEIWIVLFYLTAWGLFLEQRFFSALIIAGVMSWIKGPLYPVLFVASIGFYEILNGNWIWLRAKKTWLGLLLGAGVGISWYALAAMNFRVEMTSVFFGRENFGKLQTSQGSPQGLWAEFIFSLFPVVLALLFGLFSHGFAAHFRKRKNFYLAFGLIPALFFTFFPYRVNTYLYLLTPLLIWWGTAESIVLSRKIRICIGTISAILASTLMFLTFRLVSGGWIGLELGIPLLFILVVWSISHFKVYPPGIALTSLLIVTFIRLGAVEIGEWDLRGLRVFASQTSELAYFIDEQHEDIWHEYGLISTALKMDIQRLKKPSELAPFIQKGGGLILTDEQVAPPTAHCEDWVRIKRRMKFPFKSLLIAGLPIEDPDLHRAYHLCTR